MDKNWNVEKMAAEVRTQKRPSAQAYAWFVTGWKKDNQGGDLSRLRATQKWSQKIIYYK